MNRFAPQQGLLPRGVFNVNDVHLATRNYAWPSQNCVFGIGDNQFGGIDGRANAATMVDSAVITMNRRATCVGAATNSNTTYLYQGGYAILDDGTLWSWGYNYLNHLGHANATGQYFPTQVGTANDWASIVCVGQAQWLALKTNGELWAIGSGSGGRLFNGTTTSLTAWTRVQPSFTYTKIAGGGSANGSPSHVMAIRSDGTLWTVGSNTNGRTGLGVTTGSVTVPTQVGTDNDWVEVGCSGQSTQAIKANGTLWTVGSSLYSVSTGATTFVQVGTDTDWSKVYGAPDYVIFAIKNNGLAYRWGNPANGLAGSNTASNGTLGVLFDTDTNNRYVWISGNQWGCYALRTDGSLCYTGFPWTAPFYFGTLANISRTTTTIVAMVPPTTVCASGSQYFIFSF
jgi:alpha-tubulin suppressor-like RCC1 family protein